jgi:GNAT superfamily N-acetyltransferase
MVKIEQATIIDLASLSELFEELSGEKTDFIRMNENFKVMSKDSGYIILVARENDEVTGTAMGIMCMDLVKDCQPFMVIENVVVKSKFRGKGVGQQLMQHLETIARSRNCYYNMFVSAGHRTEAHKFYEAVGYELDLVQGFKKYL